MKYGLTELMGDYLLRIYTKSDAEGFTIEFTPEKEGHMVATAKLKGDEYEGWPCDNFYEAFQALFFRISGDSKGKYIDPLEKGKRLEEIGKRLGI